MHARIRPILETTFLRLPGQSIISRRTAHLAGAEFCINLTGRWNDIWPHRQCRDEGEIERKKETQPSPRIVNDT